MCDFVVGGDREGAGYLQHYFCGKLFDLFIYLLITD